SHCKSQQIWWCRLLLKDLAHKGSSQWVPVHSGNHQKYDDDVCDHADLFA
ncbi:hypothetical protein CDAR_25691, partial [Caerostris darwini]